MGFQVGNQLQRLADKPREFQKALKIAVARTKDGTPQLQLIANKLADLAEEGIVPAITAVADRLDGKPTETLYQTVTGITLFEAFLDALEAKRRHELNGGGGVTIEHEPAALCNGHSESGT